MSTLADTPRSRPVGPVLCLAALIVVYLACAGAALALVVAAPGTALLTAGLLALAGWAVHTTLAMVPLPVLLAGAVLAAVAPGLLVLVLAVAGWLAVRAGGGPR